MTITRIFQTGYELNSAALEYHSAIVAWGTIAASNLAAKTGTYSLRWNGAKGSVYYWFTATNQIRVGFHARLGSPRYSGQPPGVCAIQHSDGTRIMELRYELTGGTLQLYTASTLRASWAGINWDTWYHWGIDFYRHASTGWCYVYLDGLLRLSYVGNTGSKAFDRLAIGTYPTWSTDDYSGGSSYYDDLTVDDATGEGAPAPVADRRYALVTPNANGNYSQFTGSDGNQVDNYQLIDEIPPSFTDFVRAGSSGLKDSYGHTTFSLPGGASIKAVIPVAYGRKMSASDTQVALGTRLSGTDLVGSDMMLPTDAAGAVIKTERQPAKPGGGSWAEADVNNAEILIQSGGTYT